MEGDLLSHPLARHDEGVLHGSSAARRSDGHPGPTQGLGKPRALKRGDRPRGVKGVKKLFFETDQYQFMPLGAPGFADKRGCRILGWDYKEADSGWDAAQWLEGATSTSHGRKYRDGVESRWFTRFQGVTGATTPPLYAGFIQGSKGHDLSIAQDQDAHVLLNATSGQPAKRLPIRIHEVYYGKSDFFHSMTDGMPQAHSKASESAHVLYSITPQAAESLAFEAVEAKRA